MVDFLLYSRSRHISFLWICVISDGLTVERGHTLQTLFLGLEYLSHHCGSITPSTVAPYDAVRVLALSKEESSPDLCSTSRRVTTILMYLHS